MNTGGIGDGFIWLSLKLGISRSGFVVFSFLASAMVSMGAGAPIAAMFAVIPIFYPPGILLGSQSGHAGRGFNQRYFLWGCSFPKLTGHQYNRDDTA